MMFKPRQEIAKGLMPNWKRAIIVVIVFQVVLGLVYLKTVPRFYMDEAWESSVGYSLAYEGIIRHQCIEGQGGINIHMVQPRFILPLVCAAFYKVMGFSLTTGRFSSLFVGALAIVGLYAVMKRWFGEKQAVWIAAATILHPWFFEISRRVRPEIYFTALGIWALWCAVWALDFNSRKTAFLTGTFAALAGLAHVTGFVMDIAIAGAVLIWLRNKRIWRLVLWAIVSFAAVMLVYIIYVFWCLRDPRVSFFGQMFTNLYNAQVSILATEINRWQNFLQLPKGIPLAAIMIVSWFVAWYRSTSADKALATIIGVFAVIIPFASVNAAGRYLAVLTPFFCALMVRLVFRNATNAGIILKNWRKSRLFVSVGMVVVYLLMCVTGISLMFYRLHGADFDKVLDRISTVVGREDRVYGEMALWMGHDRFHYGPFPYSVSPQQRLEMVRKYPFDYAVRSAWLFNTSHGIALPPADMPAFRPDNVIDQVCQQFGTKVDAFYDPYFGPFEIYKIDWGDN